MTRDEEQVLAAARRFYDAIEALVSGQGLEKMKAVWRQTADVSSAHPLGDWANGWEEIHATWQVFASYGGEGKGGTQIRNLRAHVYGDIAYTTCVFVASPAFGSFEMNCTNIFVRDGGDWKVVHHHPDKAPDLERVLAQQA